MWNKLSEFFQQQDGALCALQWAVVGGFSIYWVVWAWLSFQAGSLQEPNAGLLSLLSGMLVAKVAKDYVDYKAPVPPSQ